MRRAALPALAGLGLAATLWAYLPLLDNYFVCDDFAYLQVGETLAAEPGLWLAPAPLDELYIGAWKRPVGNALWAVLTALFGHQAPAYYVLLIGLHLLNAALLAAWLSRRVDATVGLLAALLFATAYGPRNGVCWISNLNESFCLTLALTILMLRDRPGDAGSAGSPSRLWLLTALVILGCLVKESIAPVLLLLLRMEWLDDRVAWRRWLGPGLLFAGYLAWRLAGPRLYYSEYALGPHLLGNWISLVTASFASDLFPVWVTRRLDPSLLPLLTAAVALVVVWLAARGRGEVRVLAGWVALQPLVFAPLASLSPDQLPSRYLYLATAPAMGLAALGLVTLWRRANDRRILLWPAVILTIVLLCWQVYGLQRNRLDETQHWQVASDTLRRDFALFDAADLPAGAHVVLWMPPDQVPAGGAWWGWEGYPLVAARPVASLRRHVGPSITVDEPKPYAVFRYSKERGPQLIGFAE